VASYDFYFTRLTYESGDWDVDVRMPSNVLNSLVEYTTLRVDPVERIVALSDPKMLEAPFCYFAGHKLVQFTAAERKNLERYIKGGGFLFVDDCNHDIDGLFAKSFEAETTEEEEIAMVSATTHAGLKDAEPVMDVATLLRLQQLVRDIEIGDHLLAYATRLVRATRPSLTTVPAVQKHIGWGAGPRAGQALVLASKARALMQGRLAVTRDDIAAMLLPVLAHRVLRNFEAEADGVAIADILQALREHIRPD